MSRKWLVVGICLIVAVGALIVFEHNGHQVRAAMAATPGSSPSIAAEVQQGLTLLVAAAGGLGTIIAYFHSWTGSQTVETAKDVVTFVLYANERKSIKASRDRSTDPAFRASGRQMALAQFDAEQAAARARFEADFPLDPKIDQLSVGAKS